MHYYNENDPYAASWIENLILDRRIPDGHVDKRSVVDVIASDISGYVQCHFFAGIAIWPLALRIAGWPEDRQIWTASCPCQPFSGAGLGEGFDDPRHLWPYIERLARKLRPAELIGEQVSNKDAEPWLDLVFADMERLGYACGAVASSSAGVGAPQIRERAYWAALRMADADDERLEGRQQPRRECLVERTLRSGSLVGGLADTVELGCEQAGQRDASTQLHGATGDGLASDTPGPVNGFWRDTDWIALRDGTWRPVEPGSLPLGDGDPSYMGRLRAYGNAINPWHAAEFIKTVMEVRP